MKKGAIILATALASLVSKGNFANTTQIKDNAKNEIMVTFDGHQSKQDKNTFYAPITKQVGGVDKEPDLIDHQTIITMNMDDILAKYGKMKWMELIKTHLVLEINNYRRSLNNDPLVAVDDMNLLAQTHAQVLAKNKSFSHIDANGGDVSDRADAEKINYTVIGENLWYNKKTINDIVNWYKNGQKTGHFEIFSKDYSKIWIGLYINPDWTSFLVCDYSD